ASGRSWPRSRSRRGCAGWARNESLAVRDRGLWRGGGADARAAAVGVRVDAPRRSGRRRAQTSMKPKNQRLVLVAAAIVAVLLAVLLAMWGLRERASYFYTPAEIAAGKASQGESIR